MLQLSGSHDLLVHLDRTGEYDVAIVNMFANASLYSSPPLKQTKRVIAFDPFTPNFLRSCRTSSVNLVDSCTKRLIGICLNRKPITHRLYVMRIVDYCLFIFDDTTDNGRTSSTTSLITVLLPCPFAHITFERLYYATCDATLDKGIGTCSKYLNDMFPKLTISAKERRGTGS